MSTDEKIRFGMIAVTGASVVLVSMGVHPSPLVQISGYGVS